ncbi:hypothetical protein Lalb_Chr16g0376511 [Lupinus albus]|uniref:Uncharacterized protein n=1 Tax=Lupinus albus TaxID=3870 RepID=A0A6A4P4J9_LUPAL|nr:hypothetical protein Lalb_Chr16g0376511 [Lupinus albus]
MPLSSFTDKCIPLYNLYISLIGDAISAKIICHIYVVLLISLNSNIYGVHIIVGK